MKSRQPQAFTLIELLVVISIIALLIGILLPALGSARFTARVLACSTQMQQLGRAIAAYQTDNDGYYPVLFQEPANSSVSVGEYTWDDLLGNGYDGRSLREADAGGPEALDDAWALYQCPLDDWERRYFGNSDVAPRTYSMNRMNLQNVTNTLRGVSGTLADGSPGSRRVDDVANSSGAIVLDENIAVNLAGSPPASENVLGSGLSVGAWPVAFDPRFNTNIASALGHHSRGTNPESTVIDNISANYLFADGHVAGVDNVDTFRAGGTGELSPVWNSRGTLWDASGGQDN